MMKLFFRAAADEMQECSASIVLKYLQVDSSSQFYQYRNFIHLLFPDQVKIFFGQNN